MVTERIFRGQGVAKAVIQQAYYQRSGWQAVEQRHIAGEAVTVMVLHLAQ